MMPLSSPFCLPKWQQTYPTLSGAQITAKNWRKNLQYCHEIIVGISYDKGSLSMYPVQVEPDIIII
jgi:hypothetical protein